jgi:hypothetical protein
MLLAIVATGSMAFGAEKYAATVDDGTAKVIKGSTRVDQAAVKEEYIGDEAAPAPKPAKKLSAPKNVRHTVSMTEETVSADNDEASALKRENAELKRRLTMLEKAKAEVKAETAAATQDEDATEKVAEANDVAPGAAAAETASTEEEVPAEQMQAQPIQPKKPVVAAAKKVLLAPMTISAVKKTADVSTAPVAATPAVAAAEPTKKPAKQADKFDAVPDERVAEIATRLKYTNEILKRFGRAYDYRSTTLSEFKKILGELEATEDSASVKKN